MTSVRAFYGLMRPYAGIYGLSLILVMAATFCYLLLPPQLGKFIHALNNITENNNYASVALRCAVTAAALLGLNAVINMALGVMVVLTSEKIVNVLRSRFFSHLLRQPVEVSQRRQLGHIASEFNSDLALVQEGLSSRLVDFMRHSLFAIGGFAALLYLDHRLTLFTLAAIAIMATLLIFFMKTATQSILAVQQQRAQVLGVLVEGVSNAYVIQAYRRITFMEDRFYAQLQKTFLFVRKHAMLMSAVSPLSLIVFSILMVFAVTYGVSELRDGHLKIDDLISYFTYALMLMSSVSQINFLGSQLRQAAAMALKHQYLLAQTSPGYKRIETDPAPTSLSEALPEVRLRGVGFKYDGARNMALQDIGFSIPAGRVTAIVGESGAGKSTVAALLAGLIAPQSGSLEMLLNGKAIIADDPQVRIAIVPQEPFLFSGTFFENITFGRQPITRQDVTNAAIAARIHDDIMFRFGGYEAEIHEGGRNLSRGQRQRIAIARALAGKPNLLLLDEATSSLDVVSERAIQALIEELKNKITVVIIAHQGSLLDTIDHLIILDRGGLSYEGDPVRLNTYLGLAQGNRCT